MHAGTLHLEHSTLFSVINVDCELRMGSYKRGVQLAMHMLGMIEVCE
jgi:hypothetical protein